MKTFVNSDKSNAMRRMSHSLSMYVLHASTHTGAEDSAQTELQSMCVCVCVCFTDSNGPKSVHM